MQVAITRSLQRDEYITAQAFHVAIKAMEAVEPDYLREPSNIADMKLIFETRYPSYVQLFAIQDAELAKRLAGSDLFKDVAP
jgi:hypothetical protein